MRIERIHRWQWGLAGLAAGVALGAIYCFYDNRDLMASGDVIGDQRRFETMLLDHDGDVPRFRELVVHPATREQATMIVTGRYYRGPGDEAGHEFVFAAPSPYPAGPALARVARMVSNERTPNASGQTPSLTLPRSTGGGNDSVAGTSNASNDLAGRYKAIAQPTVTDYLDLLGEYAAVEYQYAWSDVRWVAMLCWAAGGVVLIGGIWPTIINLLVFKRLSRLREPAASSLWNVKATNAARQAPTVLLGSQGKDSAEDDLMQSPSQQSPQPHAAPIRDLATATAEPPGTQHPHAPKHFGMKPGSYYPTESTQRNSGFTLVELLVVIGIIAILIAIILPVIGSSRKRSQQAQCASNLRQIGMELEGYSQTYKQLPDATTADALFESLKEIDGTSGKIFVCPSDDSGARSYTMNAKFAGLLKSAGNPTDVLVSESGSRHFGKSNTLYFDGRVE